MPVSSDLTYNYGVDSLTYTDAGEGPITILLIHGFGGDRTVWEHQINYLSKYYRLIAPNLPGVHCQPLPMHHSETPTLFNYVEVLHELMHHLSIDTYYIMGHSMGGYIGLAFADYYVNHVKGLGLIHSSAFEDSEAKKASRIKVAEFIETFGTRRYLETAVANLYAKSYEKAHPEIIQDRIDMVSDISPKAMIQFTMAMKNRKPYTALLSQKRIPIWMIVGKEDLAIPFEDSKAQLDLLPQKNVLVLDHVGHMGMLESPDQVNEAIHKFIQHTIK